MTADPVHCYRGLWPGELADVQPAITALLYWAEHTPDAPYLTTIARSGDARTWTYRETALVTRRLAAALPALDLEPGAAVALSPVNDGPSVMTLLALMRIGCRTLLVNPADPPLRRQQLTDALGIGLTLCAPDTPAIGGSGVVPLPIQAMDDTAGVDDSSYADARIGLLDDALYFGTSGSTAASKLVAQSQLNIGANAAGVRRHHAFDTRTRVLSCLPIHHVNALHFTVLATLTAGAHAILAFDFDPLRFHRLIEHWSPRIVSVVPSVLDALLKTWRQPRVPDGFEYFVSAAAPLGSRLARDVTRTFGRRVLQGYGLTETTNFSTTIPRGLSDADYRRIMLDCDIPSIGVELYGNEVVVGRPDGTPADAGEIGEIVMRGHNVMNGYAGNEAETRLAFEGGWFHSGDLGYAIDDAQTGQRFFVVTGRLKNVAKVRGESVSLEEMDRALCAQPGVQDAACVALPDPVLGESIVAAVRCSSDCADAALRAGLAALFPAVVLPRRFVRVDAIPRTPTGKLRRRELAEQLAPGEL